MNERARWQALASEIIDYLNDLFDRGSLEGRQFVDAYKSGGITSLIMENSESVEEKLRDAANRNNILKAEIELWWLSYQLEYGQEKDKFSVLAQSNISNWIGKFLFAHILQARDERAQSVAQIKCSTSPDEALEIFKNLSEQCNFWTIFSDNVGLTSISEVTWDQLKQFNLLLSELRIGEIDQAQLSEVLEATVEVARRKLRGQYPTPSSLSQLLVRLCLQNKIDDKFIDPCCGSGTIARAALEIKLATDISPNAVASSIYASDLDAQALQIATFGLAKPALMHHPLKVFHQDAFELEPETEVTFRNPTDGSTFSEQLGEFNAICSNLPFVAQMGRKQFGNGIAGVNEVLGDDLGKLPSKSDIAAYLPFAFHSILKEEGRLGIIITNSWLGTDWGDVFFNRLCNFYKLKFVITSGAGRWFQNAAIVTNILILEKLSTDQVDLTNESIDFVVLQRPLQELEDVESNEQATAQIELGQSHGDTMTIRSVSFEKLEKFRIFGLAGNAQFVNCDWVLELPLASVRSLFNITRGMRRGWNDLFYPEKGHKIEDEYIEAVVKSPTEITGLTSSPKSQAFCCSHSISELEELGHHGAIEWISRFQDTVNTQGKPLTDVLATQGQLWYEMKASSMAEIVMSLGYGDRLFISRLNQPAFVDQRLIRVNSKDGVDLELCHALLNCTIGLFMIEGIGFGRGQGVLDLNKDRMEKFMHMLDPSQLNESSVLSIKEAFEPLLKREIFDVVDELEQPDRKHFDNTVLKAYGLNISREIICDSLLALLSIRQAATESV
jgi:tRNA1(Val) A37 N6-methylase TrmN6